MKGLLKACVSGQEKVPFCNKNGAASDAHIRHVRAVTLRRKKEVAGPTHLHALPHVDLRAGWNSVAVHQIADGATSG